MTTFTTERFAALVLLLAAVGAHAQQVYRIVGPDGRVTFSDRPAGSAADKAPPASAAPVELPGRPASVDTTVLPYELRQVVQRYPVTFYAAADCAPCSDARSLLRGRGVPFVEKTIATPEDNAAFSRLSGGTTIPYVTIGAQALQGFASAEWTQYLDLAGYPKQSQLPVNYQAPQPSALAPVQRRAPAQVAPAVRQAPATPAAPAANPNGIQF
ncbi:glutaredoxin family protein [Xylophilus sp. GOD-11R]|uniref:glutaredoxin family protein n=1 Tax=Xylophilus sp. GOD-11R TaxID=3089814 RepID=UPI00298C5FED|nr:glutaredoxin family protein [Xylophilus sp. GOD-11R]WPB58466.1 glutaredoxin family protein [Xylophilus sp. GOD-11R]